MSSQLSPLEQLEQQSQQQQPAAQTNSTVSPLEQLEQTHSQAPEMGYTISAYHPPTTLLGKIGEWVDHVQSDLKNGTDQTGIGTVLKAMGAHGLNSGGGEYAGDLIASLPLGILKATKGATELAPQVIGGPQGRTWQGVKDLVGGGLKAMTVPAAFVAPEASAVSEEGLLNDAANIASKVTPPVGKVISGVKALATDIPAKVESKLLATLSDLADTEGLTAPTATNIKEAIPQLADQFKQRAQGVYQKLDEAAPGFQDLKDKIAQYTQAVKANLHTDPNKADELASSLQSAKTAMSELLDDGQKAEWKAADQDWSRYKALQTVSSKTSKSAEDLTDPALTSVDKLGSATQQLTNSVRKGNPIDLLSKAFGPDHAGEIRAAVQEGLDMASHSQAAKQFLKWAAYSTPVIGGLAYGADKVASILSKGK
jgi:hypothetical protein